MKLLIIEDDEITREMIVKTLKNEAEHIFDSGRPVEALKIIKQEKPDFIILDIILPEIDGFGVCQIIRKYPDSYGNPFILMLTSKNGEEDIIKGLDAGADDYIKKPFSYKELTARVKAIARRKERDTGNSVIYDTYVIDTEKNVITDSSNGEPVELFKKEIELFIYMVKNKGIVLTRENIFENVWDEFYVQGDRTVDNYIWKLKSKLTKISDKIKSVRGMGYKLEK